MPGRPPSYPNAVREYVVEQVCDAGRPLKPIVEALNAGQVDGMPKYAVSYSAAQRWVAKEAQLRDRAIPLEDQSLDAFVTRLWAIAGGELRKLERDARARKPLDIKRLNELEAFAARCRRHLAKKAEPETAQPEVAPGQEKPQSLLEQLAAAEPNPEPLAAASDPPTTPPNAETTNPAPRINRELEDGDESPALTSAAAMQPRVA